MTACDQARWPHRHLRDGWMTVGSRDPHQWWKITIRDDGSICDRDVTPTPPTHDPERVLAFLLGMQERINTDTRREGRKLNP